MLTNATAICHQMLYHLNPIVEFEFAGNHADKEMVLGHNPQSMKNIKQYVLSIIPPLFAEKYLTF